MTTYRLWAGEFGSINVIIPEDVEVNYRVMLQVFSKLNITCIF